MPAKNAIIIGGGASGLFCAIALSRLGVRCTVLERNERLGRKLLITGKGRCNVTNNCDAETVMKNIPRNPKFLYSALQSFAPSDTMRFFEELGVKLKTERGGRVFPVSDKAQTIVSALENEAKRLGVKIINERAAELIIDNGIARGVKCKSGEYLSDRVIVATGGSSYPATGSTGDGYSLARMAGHTVMPIRAALVPMVTKESECAQMAGLSLKNVTLSLIDTKKNKVIYSELGEMLFTHFGISGPLVLTASSHMDGIENKSYAVDIDLKPALTQQQLDARILRDFSQELNRDFSNSLGRLLPSSMIPIIVKRSGIPPETKVNTITKAQRRELVEAIKRYRLHIEALRPVEEAIITRGGVKTSEVSPKTMESKLVRSLYFIGEVLDVDAYTGGFNLQIAFSEAYACAQGIVSETE